MMKICLQTNLLGYLGNLDKAALVVVWVVTVLEKVRIAQTLEKYSSQTQIYSY